MAGELPPIDPDELLRFEALDPLEPEDRSILASFLVRRRFAPRQTLTVEGELEDQMFFLLSGEANIEADGVSIGPLREGEHFGEMGLVGDLPRAASAVARTEVEVAVLDRDALEGLAERAPKVALQVERMLLRGVSDRLASFAKDMSVLLDERSLPRRTTLTVHVGSNDYDVPMGTVVQELLPRRVDDQLVVGALVDQRAKSLTHRLSSNASLVPLTTAHWEGQRIYQRSLGLMLVEAAHRVDPSLVVRLGHSVGLGQRVQVVSNEGIDAVALARRLAEEMRALEAEDRRLREEWWMVGEAVAFFEKQGWMSAAKLLDTHYDPAVRLVSYGEIHALRQAPFLPSTAMMKHYDVIADEAGILLVFGSESAKTGTFSAWPGQKEVFSEVRIAAEHTGRMMEHHARWLATLGIDSVGAFNRACVTGDVSQLIRVSEGFQEKQLSTIADVIHERGESVKVICIAGPSSSGKSTFIRRLTVQLQVNGMAPVGLGLDDYYIDREDTPRDEEGNLDFEDFGAIRADLLAEQVTGLLAGEMVKTAHYDFKRGKSMPHGGKELRLLDNEVLILEGIHGLNPRLLESVSDDRIYRIFICPLAQLPLDRVSRVHASDLRLLRRIVRDRHNRGSDAARTIAWWPSVRRGERRNIFPYQHLADAVFDTSLIYELSVLRVFAERYLLEVLRPDPAYPTAHRLLNLLSRFISIYPDHVPPTSILREFIGGSGFEY